MSSFPDELQAEAAGLAEGYLTYTSIVEFYKEFHLNGICSKKPLLCQWVNQRLKLNQAWVDGMVAQHSQIGKKCAFKK